MFFGSCQQKKGIGFQEEALTEMTSTVSDSHVAIIDSMHVYLIVDAESALKASYEWKWARLTRAALCMAEKPANLNSLDVLSFDVDKIYVPPTTNSPSEVNEAAGVFAATPCCVCDKTASLCHEIALHYTLFFRNFAPENISIYKLKY